MSEGEATAGCGAWRENEAVGTYVCARHDQVLHARINDLRVALLAVLLCLGRGWSGPVDVERAAYVAGRALKEDEP